MGPAHDPGDATETLVWRVRESLLAYVEGLPDGVVRWQPGQLAGSFPAALGREGSGERRRAFSGGLLLRGHGGMLDVLLSDPILDLDAGMLLVTVRRSPDPVAILRIGAPEIAEEAEGFRVTYPAPVLTADGAAVFGGSYAEGETFDPLVVSLPRREG